MVLWGSKNLQHLHRDDEKVWIVRTNFHFAKYIPVSRIVFDFEEWVESIRAPVFAGLLVEVLTFHLILLKENQYGLKDVNMTVTVYKSCFKSYLRKTV